jgi:hypothetical protein
MTMFRRPGRRAGVVLPVVAAVVLVGVAGCTGGGHAHAAGSVASTTVLAFGSGAAGGGTATTTGGAGASGGAASGGGAGGAAGAGAGAHAAGPGASVSAASVSGQLLVTLAVTPVKAKAGATIGFTITATAGHATGGLGYQITYGDGRSDHNTVPKFCIGGTGAANQASWAVSHRYTSAGSYGASVRVYVNCGVDAATTAAVTLGIS